MSHDSPDQVVRAYLDAARAKASLSETERIVFSVYAFEMEISNGGFHQFFLNPSGDKWEETLFALRDIGATRIAEMFEKALTVFPQCTPSKDQVFRRKQLRVIGTKAETMLSELDSEYYSLFSTSPEEDSYARLAAYITSRQR